MAAKDLGIPWWIYVGTQGAGGKGIHLFQMKTSDNPDIPEFVTMTPLGLVAETPSPSFLVIDPKQPILYCVNEIDQFEGKRSGAISSFVIEPASGKLAPLDQRPSMGVRPGHLALHREGQHLLVANQDAVSVFPLAYGKLRAAADVRPHAGKSRPQGVTFSPDNQFVFVCDPGLDRVMTYRFEPRPGKLVPHQAPFTTAKAGAGPRRLVFGADGKFAYVVNELDSTVTAMAHQAGRLTALQTLSTLPGHYDGPNRAAEIAIHPSQKHLFVSNCGHNSIVLFSIDPQKGTLTYVEDQSTYGKMPLHFGLDTPGKHLAVANRESGSILILRAPENARVKPAGNVVKMPAAACAVFLSPAAR